MLKILYNYDNFILEKYGYNEIASTLSNKVISTINDNFGKLLVNKKLFLKNKIGEVSHINFIDDTINIKLSDKTYGNMNPSSLIIEGKNIYNLIINLEMKLNDSEIKAKKSINNDIIHTISHESLHIIELFLTSDNEKDFSNSWKMGEKLQNLKNRYNDDNWQNISYFIYLSLPHELRGRLQQLNSHIKKTSFNNIIDTQDYIKKTKIFKDIEFLSMMDENLILNKLKQDLNYKSIIKDFSEYFLEKNGNYESNFIKYIKGIKIKNKKYLNKVLKTSYNIHNFSEQERIIDYKNYE